QAQEQNKVPEDMEDQEPQETVDDEIQADKAGDILNSDELHEEIEEEMNQQAVDEDDLVSEEENIADETNVNSEE
ncbi:MAG: hypothetical protein SPL76_02225, partial [Cyanobacteriota bacterium]|nr:hypothetical protein [Cyanobacteriota bacterium]